MLPRIPSRWVNNCSIEHMFAPSEVAVKSPMWSRWVRPRTRYAPITASGGTLYLAQPIRHDNGVVGRDPGRRPVS
jgi:hypothetical protein